MRCIRIVCLVIGLLTGAASFAADVQFVEGKDYTVLPNQIRSKTAVQQLLARNPSKVQLLFFFSYGCPACFKFDPYFEAWLAKQTRNEFVVYRIPVLFEENWDNLAKLYYTGLTLDPKQPLNADIFNAIHKQHLTLEKPEVMQKFFVDHGYSGAEVNAIFNSSAVAAKVKTANEQALAYDINETPTIIINGPQNSYLLTLEQANADPNRMLDIAKYIITKEQKKL